MKNDFLILPLDGNLFAEEHQATLMAAGARWVEVDSRPAFPCRVTLEEAKVGERVLLLTFCHHETESPYKATGPIFVREQAKTVTLSVNEVPPVLRHRLLSLRGYAANGEMLDADVTEGADVQSVIDCLFDNAAIEYIHIHNAKQGCFSCKVVRA
ncbi:hypothetical protein CS022_10535 [Veronia nyctiphanis]|uniref:DUF1203 domain-containing protein n=1 Tax=Veronia nyctiphanis TaxID=1278244 RepID=A0A4Q0YQ23_9GAMM|nr:DUF1203 domain-containing protein [Veronia nyctiphanis]RXJ73187.1 hypothetical protein CS022_10535 [Veronia nyctiphanis]